MPKEFRHIIRIADTDLDGAKKVGYAIADIKGIGVNLANVVMQKAGIDPKKRLGFLSEVEVEKVEDIIENPMKYGVPEWLLNRPRDRATGKDLHLIGSDLVLQIKSDVDQMKKIRSWRGFRHAYGLKVRGQRTRTTGRAGKTMGVRKKRRRAV